jgi:hypothetical protein
MNPSGNAIEEIVDLTVSSDGFIKAILALCGFPVMDEKLRALDFDSMQFIH